MQSGNSVVCSLVIGPFFIRTHLLCVIIHGVGLTRKLNPVSIWPEPSATLGLLAAADRPRHRTQRGDFSEVLEVMELKCEKKFHKSSVVPLSRPARRSIASSYWTQRE